LGNAGKAFHGMVQAVKAAFREGLAYRFLSASLALIALSIAVSAF
jgi:hypothetical protein